MARASAGLMVARISRAVVARICLGVAARASGGRHDRLPERESLATPCDSIVGGQERARMCRAMGNLMPCRSSLGRA